MLHLRGGICRMNEEKYQDWLEENQEELIENFCKECDIDWEDCTNNYHVELDEYCRRWFEEKEE